MKIQSRVSTTAAIAMTLCTLGFSTNVASEVKGGSLYDLTYNSGSGSFIDHGSKKWIERNSDGEHHFTEVGRDEWSVYLTRGNVGIKLDMWKQTVEYKEGNGAYRVLYTVDDANIVNEDVSDDNITTLFQHGGYGGYSVKLPEGNFTLSDLQRRGMINDDISSLKVPDGYALKIYEDDHFDDHQVIFFGIVISGGWSETFTGNSSFIRHRNDAVSSAKVYRLDDSDSPWYLDCDGFYGYFELLFSGYPIGSSCD